MIVTDLYSKLKRLKVTVQLVDDRIDLQAPKNVLNAELLNEIKENKEALKELLMAYKKSNKKHSHIEQIAVQENYALSSAQYRLWVLGQFEESNAAYNMPGVYVFTGDLNIDALRGAFAALIERHEILRTVFKQNESEDVRQFILSPEMTGFNLEYKDLRKEVQQSVSLQDLIQQVFTLPFNLEQGPLLRACLYQIDESKFVFAYAMHHIISDAWSMGILIKELFHLYNDTIHSNPAPLIPLRIQYKDYANWQQEQLNGADLKKHQAYWLKQFEGNLPVLELILGTARPAERTYKGGVIYKKINEETSHGIKKISQEQEATLFMSLLAVVNTLLYRYSHQDDIIIGSPIAGRDHEDLQNQIGFYVNTLALRTRFKGDDSFLEILDHVKKVTLDAFEHQVYPFDQLVDSLNLNRDRSRNPLFDVMLVVQNDEQNQDDEQPIGDLLISPYDFGSSVSSKFDFTFNFDNSGAFLTLALEYNTDIYQQHLVEQLAEHLVSLMDAIVASPVLEIQLLEYLSETEKQHQIVTFNDTSVSYPTNSTIIDLFERQVAAKPNAPALVFGEEKFSYKELNERANQLANYLIRNYQIQTENLIAIKLERSDWLIVSILATLKIGAAYVPIDPSYPEDRIAFMLDDCQCRVLIDPSELEKFKLQQTNFDVQNLNSLIQPGTLAYVIYTSGSTGKPKGVMVEHASVINLCNWSKNNFELSEHDRCSIYAGVGFDASVLEIFPSIIYGASIYIVPEDIRLDVAAIAAYFDSNKITIGFLPTQIAEQFFETENNSLRYLLVGGDKLHTFSKQSYQIVNNYGPTENTVVATCIKLDHNFFNIPIGKPISNTVIYILDHLGNLAPMGIMGEICIGGAGIARGYLNRPELTHEKFVANPFIPGERIYKTGDLGMWMSDGNIQFLGRKDDQVKIRGYRIELGEIENVLQEHPEIETVVVTAVIQLDGQKGLAAYIVSDKVLNTDDLQAYLNIKLPKYMIPSYFMQIEELPLTANGKIDKKRLPAPDTLNIASSVEYITPRNETEQKLLTIWQSVLKKDKISVKDNFFELGGHSINVTRLSMQIHKIFNNKPDLKDLFIFSTLEEQAAWILKTTIKTKYNNIPLSPLASYYPLSAGQRRLWVLSQFEESNAAYNMPGVYVFTGDLNIDALREAFAALIERHEILRTVFQQNELEEVRQFILSPEAIGFNLNYKDLRKELKQEEVLEALIQSVFALPFNLEQGPLLRAVVYQVEADKFVFAYVMHHIISDGWSMGILIKELLQLYNDAIHSNPVPLKPLPIQYKDYGAWQQEQLSGEGLKKQETYWLKQFEGELPVLELAQGAVRPTVQTYRGGIVYKMINAQTSVGIKKISQEQGGTLFMGLLAVVNTLLYRYSNQEDIIIGSPIAGREHSDLENQIGFYVNTLALRTRFKGEDSFVTLLKQVKEVTLGAYEHQVYPFDELVHTLNLHRDMSRNPLFDVMVMLQNNDSNQDNEQLLGDLQVNSYDGSTAVISKFDFTFNFEDFGNELSVGLEYNSDIYTQEIAEQLAEHLVGLIQAIVETPTMEIRELNYLSDAEREQLLATFNDTTDPYPADKTIIDLFEEQVTKTPNAIALVYEEKQFSYNELNAKANQFGHYLKSKHSVKAEDLIGIKLERNDWMLIVLLGILKSGAAYLPIDMDYPSERIDYMLADSKCKLLIDEEVLKGFRAELDELNSKNVGVISQVNHLAYVIYTSGSTGNPKGVMIEHGNAVAFISWCKKEFSNSKFDTVFAVTSICFDLSVFELIYTLCVGKKIRLLSNALAVPQYLDTKEVILLNMVPSAVGALLTEQVDFTQVKVLNMAGEPIPEKYLASLDVKNIEIRNLYGPSEDTTYSSVYQISNADDPILIGHPIANTQFYILNTALQPQPIGVMGEIYISGKGLTRGYLHKAELTDEKFVKNPFRKGERMYKTGDLGKWQSDGNMEFLGRIDDQVKIRGYRIELGEIENALEKHPSIEATCVLAQKNSDGQNEVAAYFVTDKIVSISELRNFLSVTLPAYMVPAHWIKIDLMPLTPNGKIDKKKLPAPETQGISSGVEYITPRNETEEKLLAIWQVVLKKDKISVLDNFFELGGNSLIALRMHSLIKKTMHLQLKIQDIYHNPTIETLANTQTEYTSLLKLQSAQEVAAKNIYFIPPVIGNCMLYKPLAQMLGANFNSFGFQYSGLEKGEPLFESIEQAATVFCKQLICNQNGDDLILVGYSMGGNIAFEMAKILEKRHLNVSLVLIDTVVKTDSNDSVDYENETDWLIKQYRILMGEDEVQEEFLRRFLNNNFKLFNKYEQTGKIKNKLHLFEAQANHTPTNMKKWDNFTTGETMHEFIEGGHWDALNASNLKVYKRQICNCLMN